MARYQVILAYDGTDFDGFQRQAKGIKNRTVQGEIEDALRRIGWQGASILSAGRTDAGVHASAQVAAFDFEWKHNSQDLLAALNANLPGDIAARQVCETREDFHPRYDALARRYRYRIFCDPLRDPLRERYAWRVWPVMDLEQLQRASKLLLGRHDFGAFGSPPRPQGTTVRCIYQAGWTTNVASEGHTGFVFEVVGNAFLYRMVRRLVSLQVQIGQGVLRIERLAYCLESGEKNLVRTLAPPQGLSLDEVIYHDPAGLLSVG